ncbi:MAG: protein kinase [Gemmatimonadales bacterium]|nr:protein kinase [Gemmatimonadales bacterium]MDZ4390460.1 protein kinase [Gemmatimonadales bacterium]
MSSDLTRLAAALADRYRLERELGAGGMATVYLAHDLKHKRKVAIKVMKPEVSAELAADRFHREIRTTANLQHPHIVPLFDSGTIQLDNPSPDSRLTTHRYFVMPLIEGETLRDRLEREGQLPIDEAIRLICEVADALQYAHEAGILHRDLKPENVMLSRGHALLADFGIARTTDTSDDDRLTRAGSSIGTPAYMSPEQATGERELTASSDVYGLGAILFELLTGRPPFTGPTPQAILIKRFTTEAPPVRTLRSDVPDRCEAAVARALANDPELRFATAAAFAVALHPGDGASATAPVPVAEAGSLVVLPFRNQGSDPEDEQFADGLTEEILTDLARVRAIRVISRASSMQLKGTTKTIPVLARELRVRHALSGSVRRAGASLRITAELIDASTDTPVWAERFSGTMDDIFDVQERVAREIVGALGITLTSEEDRRLSQRPIEDPRAFELYLRARQGIRRYDGASIEHAEDLVRQAIGIVGEVAPLKALLAWAKVIRVRAGVVSDKGGLDEATAVAEALIREAPDAPYGHALLGYIGHERGRIPEAIVHLRAALERDPDDVDALIYLAIGVMGCGDTTASERALERLIAVDPLAPMTWMLAGAAPWWIGRAEEGLPDLERALAMDPSNPILRWTLGYARAIAGDVSGAAKDAAALLEQAPTMPYTSQLRAVVQGLQGRQEEARTTLRDVQLLDAHQTFHLAEAFAVAGDTERALALLEEAVDTGFHPGEFIAIHCPFFAALRGTPRFEAIADKALRLTQEFVASGVAP